MGEAKRRKLLDSSFGKIPRKVNYKIPSSVPQDYKRYSGFKPCFGYVYMVQYQDFEPCLFVVRKEYIVRSISSNTFSLGLDDSGVATIEMKNSETQQKFYEYYLNPDVEVISFVAFPNSPDRYTDQHGLSVIPFNINYFVNDVSSVDIQRIYYIGIDIPSIERLN